MISLTDTPQSRFLTESVVLFLAGFLFVYLSIANQWFRWLDDLVYDQYISYASATLDQDITIVAIDDESLHDFGPWPWDRELQAQLVTQINKLSPRSITLDIIYASKSPDDETLLRTTAQIPRLGLPLMIDTVNFQGLPVEVLPFPELLAQTDVLGHVQVELDDDAIVRGTYLYQGVATPRWPHLMLALTGTEQAKMIPEGCDASAGLTIAQCSYIRVPFAGPSGTYPRISAGSLLKGEMSNDLLSRALTDKTVLVGLTGLGAGDWITSPNSAVNGPMPGVEFNANLLSALRYNEVIQPSNSVLAYVIALFLVGACTYLLPRLVAKTMLMATVVLAALPMAISVFSLSVFNQYLYVSSVTIAVLIIYPIWSWRRHEIAWAFIREELNRIDSEHSAWQAQSHMGQMSQEQLVANAERTLARRIQVSEHSLDINRDDLSPGEAELLESLESQIKREQSSDADKIPGERLAAQISRLEQRAKSFREGRDIGLSGLGKMANGVVIFSALGQLRFCNQAALTLLKKTSAETLADMYEVLQIVTPPLGNTWPEIIRNVIFERASYQFEAHVHDAALFVAAEPLSSESDYADHWVLTLADLSAIRQAQAQREEALAFLSHDIRSPLLSVLALIKNHGQDSELLRQITNYTQKGLSTSDQFLQLSRLQLQADFERYEIAMDQLAANACEQVFYLAREKNINVSLNENSNGEDDNLWLEGNGELLERALVNLLTNAIKYSDVGTKIEVTVEEAHLDTHSNKEITVRVSDEGHGIPEAEIAHIFDPYFRSSEQVLAENRGTGLGLRFVKTVIERHNGKIEVDSRWGEGTTFTIRLPSPIDL
ncbi:MAG: CHASE2 domain-containing protein [Pseudomonadota bacterium]